MMERAGRRRILYCLVIPAALFVLFKALSGLGISQVPHTRVQGLYGGQPGASQVLVSALIAFAIAFDRVVEVRLRDRSLTLRLRFPPQTARVLVVALLLSAWLFVRIYIGEYADLYTTGGAGFFEAAVTFAVVMAVLKPRRIPGHGHIAG